MAKSRRAKKRSSHKSSVGEDPGPDISLLSRPSATSVKGIRDVIKAFEEGTHEVHHLLSNECEILYECRVCRSLYRSFLNFITHKRVYCQQHYTSGSPKVNHFFNDVLDEDETLIVHDESVRLTRQSNGDLPKTDVESVASTSATKPKAPPRKNLMEILGLLTQKASSSDGLKRIVNLDGYVAMSAPNSGNESTGFNGRMPRQHLLHLESMESTDVAIRQTVTLGPDGKILTEKATGNTSEDENEKDSAHTSIENETETDLACTKCNITFSSPKTYKYHMSSVHDPTRVYFLCPICKGKFANSWSVHRHMKSIHHKTNDQLRKLRNQIQKVVRKVTAEPDPSSKKLSLSPKVGSATIDKQTYVKKQMELELFEKETKKCSGCSRKFDRLAAFNYHVANCARRQVALKNVNETNQLTDASYLVSKLLITKPKILTRNSQNLSVAPGGLAECIPEVLVQRLENPTLEPRERRNSDKRSEHPVTKKIEIQLRHDYNKITLPAELSEVIVPEVQEVADKHVQLNAWSRVDYKKVVTSTTPDICSTLDEDKEIIMTDEECHLDTRNSDLQFTMDENPIENNMLGLLTNKENSSDSIILPPKELQISITDILGNIKQSGDMLSLKVEHKLNNNCNADEVENQQCNNNLSDNKLPFTEESVVSNRVAIESAVPMESIVASSDTNELDVAVDNSNLLSNVSIIADADSVLVPIHAELKDITICKIAKSKVNDIIPQKSILEGILSKIKTDGNSLTKLDSSLSTDPVITTVVNMVDRVNHLNKSKRKKSEVKRASIMDWNGFEEQQTSTVHILESDRKRFKANIAQSSLADSRDRHTHQQDICISDSVLQDVIISEPSFVNTNHLDELQIVKDTATATPTPLLFTKYDLQPEKEADADDDFDDTSLPEIVPPQSIYETRVDTTMPEKDDDMELDMSTYVECTINETTYDDYNLSEPDSDKMENEDDVPRYNTTSQACVDEDILKVIFEEEDLSQSSSLHRKKGTIIMGNGTFSLGSYAADQETEKMDASISCESSLIQGQATASSETISPMTADDLSFSVPTNSNFPSIIQAESRPSSEMNVESRPSSAMNVESRPSSALNVESRPSSALNVESRPSSATNTNARLSVDTNRSTSSSDTEQRPLSAEGTPSSSMENLAPRSRPLRNKAKVKNSDFIYDVSDKSVFSYKAGDDLSVARNKSGLKPLKHSSEDMELFEKSGSVNVLMNPTVKLYNCSEDTSHLNMSPKQNSIPKPSTSSEAQVISNFPTYGATRKSVRAITKL